MLWDEIPLRIFEIYGSPSKITLAEMLDVHRSVVTQWTAKNPKAWRHPSLELLEKVAADKNVTWDWILEGRGPKYRENQS